MASALFALGDLCTAAGKVLIRGHGPDRVKVKASFRESSFGIDLHLLHSWISSLIDMLNGKDATAAANALAFLSALGFLSGGGLIGILRKMRGRRPVSIEDGDGGMKIIILSDGERLEEVGEVVDLYRDISTRKEGSSEKFVDQIGGG